MFADPLAERDRVPPESYHVFVFWITFFALCIFLFSSSALATYAIAYCYPAGNAAWVEKYACFTNKYWSQPTWVDLASDPGPASWPGNSCLKDTGPVFNSTLNISEDCNKKAGAGSRIDYQEVF